MARPVNLDKLEFDEILNLRFCDLGLNIRGTMMEDLVNRLYSELEEKNLRFRPPCYIGDEWFSPTGIPAIALPFYLAHPKLVALEKKMFHEAEGGDPDEGMQLLRHECGHAVIHAFNLLKKKKWREVFGHPGKTYKEYYTYRPYSRSFVRNLKHFYAQSHPEEDFAETFAVWLQPDSDWQNRYRNWRALQKLIYVDQLMKSVAEKAVKVPKKNFFYNIETTKKTLKLHYHRKLKMYEEDLDSFFDRDLTRIFTTGDRKQKKASIFIQEIRKPLEAAIQRYGKGRKFAARVLVNKLKKRCSALDLRVTDEDISRLEFSAYVASLSSNHRFTGRYKGEA